MSTTSSDKDVRTHLPEPFSGDRTKLKQFLLKSRLFFHLHPAKFTRAEDKVVWVVSLLRGSAFEWIEPHVNNFLDNKTADGRTNDTMEDMTVEMFSTWMGFEDKIKRVFGDIDEEHTAEHHLESIQQHGSATAYTAQFQQWSGRTSWNEEALIHRYYVGLKDTIKDELARMDRPDSLEELITQAIRIDNRHFERNREKKGHYVNHGYRKKQQKSYWPQPMELDATEYGPGLSSTEMEKRKQGRLCYTCGKPGHIARNCKQQGGRKKTWGGKKKFGRPQQLNSTIEGRGGYIYTTSSARELNAFHGDEGQEMLLDQSTASEEPEATNTTMESQCPGYENGDVSRTDHPWHQWSAWQTCNAHMCPQHLAEHVRNQFVGVHCPVYWTDKVAEVHRQRYMERNYNPSTALQEAVRDLRERCERQEAERKNTQSKN